MIIYIFTLQINFDENILQVIMLWASSAYIGITNHIKQSLFENTLTYRHKIQSIKTSNCLKISKSSNLLWLQIMHSSKYLLPISSSLRILTLIKKHFKVITYLKVKTVLKSLTNRPYHILMKLQLVIIADINNQKLFQLSSS